MKKLITLILAMLMCFSVVMTGCDGFGGNGDSSNNEPKKLVYEDGVTYNDGIGEYVIADMLETKTDYDKSIFYRNDITAMAADPFAFYCTDKTNEVDYDHYFLFGTTTTATFNCFKSKDLVSWEAESLAYLWPEGGWQYADTWAPEVVYDANADRAYYGVDDESVYGSRGTGVYFMFCSASSKAEFRYWTDEDKGGNNTFHLDLAVAAQPQGPYRQWTGVEEGAVINGVDYGTQEAIANGYEYADGTTEAYVDYSATSKVARQNDEVSLDDHWWNVAAARASLSFQWENREFAGKYVLDGQEVAEGTPGATYIPEEAAYMAFDEGKHTGFSCLDPSPFVDPATGEKYILLTKDYPNSELIEVEIEHGFTANHGSATFIAKMHNNDWAQIDYSTLTRLTRMGYNFVSSDAREAYVDDAEDYANTLISNPTQYPLGTAETVANIPELGVGTAEKRIKEGNYINEGPQILYNKDNGLYYLILSTGRYLENCYTVIQCVSYNLFGPYRKLEVGEGSHLLSTDNGSATDAVSGPGHPTLMRVYDEETGRGEELFLLYHKHADVRAGGSKRGACIDRITWVRNDNGLLVMHVNGPTTYTQPRIYATGETPYDNLAVYPDTTITVSEPDKIVDATHGVQNLNDNIIAVHTEYDGEPRKMHYEALEPFIHEFETTAKQVTVTVDLGAYYPVVAYMLYNSRQYEKSFKSYDYQNDAGETVKWNDITKVEMDVYKDGVKTVAVFEGLEFYSDFNLFATGADVRPGSAASAVFAEIAVKQIRFTVINNNLSGILAISEVAVLGRPEAVDVA